MVKRHLIIGVYCEDERALRETCLLAESVRTFGGQFSDTLVRAYTPADNAVFGPVVTESARRLGIDRRTVVVPEAMRWLFYAGKPFAAAQAEIDALGAADVLVWMDDDTIVLDEPSELAVDPGIVVRYVPVMHNRAGSLYDKPPDEFWARVYEVLEINREVLFPMITPVDRQRIRAYFHCGLLSVRPESGVMRNWAESFTTLANDSHILRMGADDRLRNVFLHQHALTGAVLHAVTRDRMQQLSERYNYPLFFDRQYTAPRRFNSIEKAVTIRRVVPFSMVGDNWHTHVIGPADKTAWLKKHIG